MIDKYREGFLEKPNKDKRTYTLEINTTNKCNMKCSYCFEDESVRKNHSLLNYYIDLLKVRIKELVNSDFIKNNFEGLTLDFWGGEPTLNMPLIKELFDTFKYRPDMYFHVYSNGFQVDELMEMAINIKEKGCPSSLRIQFSYDGQPIHDMRRLARNGNLTGEKIIHNAKFLYEHGINVDFKATITPPDFKFMSQVWDDFKNLHDIFGEVAYAPTIDSDHDYGSNYIEDLERSLINIARKEIDFYKENGIHLLKWFKLHLPYCSAGQGMTTVDTNGKVYLCHGCLYNRTKEDAFVTSIFESSFVEDLERVSTSLKEYDFSHLENECKKCLTNYCVKCNSRALEKSQNEKLEDRWFNFSCQPNLCEYFKLIGKIQMAMKKVIRGGN